MADNTTLNVGDSGDVYASNDIGGVKYQRVKIGIGDAGTAVDMSNAVPLPTRDTMLEIARGNVTGHSVVNKFGENDPVGSGTTEDVWDGGGTYTFPSTADITHIRQAVDQSTMRGKVIEVQGLDTSWALTVQDVTLDASNTTTAVSLGTALRRVFRMKVLADVVTTQNVELRNTGGGTTYAVIQAGNNQTLMAIYTVPDGVTAYMTKYFYDVVASGVKTPLSVSFGLWVADRDNSYEFQLKHSRGVAQNSSPPPYEFSPYFKITQKSDIKMTASPSNKDAHVHAGFDLILVDN